MRFNVTLSELAERQYDNILAYISDVLKNPQALQNVMDDFDDTIEKLETTASSLGYCKSNRLKEMGLLLAYPRVFSWVFKSDELLSDKTGSVCNDNPATISSEILYILFDVGFHKCVNHKKGNTHLLRNLLPYATLQGIF